jgi:hypothetical protein
MKVRGRGTAMKGSWPAAKAPGTMFLCVLMTACGSAGTNPVGPASNAAPSIASILVTPTTVAPGGTAAVAVHASDPDGDTVTCHFSADHGIVTVGDSSHTCASGIYQNNRDGAASDTIHATVTDAANNSVTTAAGVAIAGAPAPSPNPNPGPTPAPNPSPGATPTPPPPGPTVTVSGGGSCHPKSPSTPCTVNFSARVTGGQTPLSYSWSGCTSGSGTSESCKVNAIKSFTSTVTVKDALGRSATASGTATGILDKSPQKSGGTGCGGVSEGGTAYTTVTISDDSAHSGCSVWNVSGPCGVKISDCADGVVQGAITGKAPGGSCTWAFHYTNVWGQTLVDNESCNVN